MMHGAFGRRTPTSSTGVTLARWTRVIERTGRTVCAARPPSGKKTRTPSSSRSVPFTPSSDVLPWTIHTVLFRAILTRVPADRGGRKPGSIIGRDVRRSGHHLRESRGRRGRQLFDPPGALSA